MDAWPFQSDLTLTAMPRAAFWARRFAEEVLREWKLDRGSDGVQDDAKGSNGGMGDGLIDRVLLVVTELTTNAVKATEEMMGTLDPEVKARYSEQPSAVSYLELAKLGQVRLRLSTDNARSRVLIEVWDACEAEPELKDVDFLSESGRGLHLVATYCAKWGWYPSFEVERSRPERPEATEVWDGWLRDGTRREWPGWRRGKVVWGEVRTLHGHDYSS
jgi:anti-sigma regulatory factor (Ser/Thr protein kinase)